MNLTFLRQVHFKCFLNETISNHFLPCPSGISPILLQVICDIYSFLLQNGKISPYTSIFRGSYKKGISTSSLCSAGLLVHFSETCKTYKRQSHTFSLLPLTWAGSLLLQLLATGTHLCFRSGDHLGLVLSPMQHREYAHCDRVLCLLSHAVALV